MVRAKVRETPSKRAACSSLSPNSASDAVCSNIDWVLLMNLAYNKIAIFLPIIDCLLGFCKDMLRIGKTEWCF